MRRRISIRFSLRNLLVAIAISAIALGGFLEWRRVRTAREEYEHALARRQVRIITLKDTATAADKLYEVELATLWIPRRTATRWHVERLNRLAEDARISVMTTMFGSEDGRNKFIRECNEVKAKAAKLAADNSLELPDEL
jgi:hypothetical protein